MKPDGLTPVYTCTVLESCDAIRFDADDARLYIVSNKGGDVDLIRLVLLDPATGREELVEADPQKRVDFGDAVFSDAHQEAAADEATRTTASGCISRTRRSKRITS